MGDHCRKQIRDAVASALAAMTSASYVATGQVNPVASGQLPAAVIHTPEEESGALNKAEDNRRVLTLTIAGHAQADDVVDYLDTMAVEIEVLMAAAGSLPAWIKEALLTSTSVELSGEASTPTGVIRLEYQIIYHVNPAAPDTPLS